MRALIFTLGVMLLGTWVLPPRSACAQSGALEDVRDQGILYFKKEHFKPALAKLTQAYEMPGGKEDFRVVLYRARTAYKLLLLELAFEMARKAVQVAGDDEKNVKAAEELLQEMSSLYGGVTFVAAKGETNKKGRIFFEAKTGIINPDKKKRFLSIRERFQNTDVEFPTTLYLPYGDYLANKVPFSIVQDQEIPTVEIFLQVVVGDKEEADSLWWYVGIGGAAAAAAGVGAFLLFSGDETKEVDQIRLNLPKSP